MLYDANDSIIYIHQMKKVIDMLKNKFGADIPDDTPSGAGQPPAPEGASSAPPPGPAPSSMDVSDAQLQ